MEFKIVVKGMVFSGDDLLVVKRSSHDTINPGRLSVPAGFVKFGEKPQDAVRREIKEETGLDVEVGRVTSVWTQILREESIQIVGINYFCIPSNKNITLNEELESYQWINTEKYDQYDLPKEIIKEITHLQREKII